MQLMIAEYKYGPQKKQPTKNLKVLTRYQYGIKRIRLQMLYKGSKLPIYNSKQHTTNMEPKVPDQQYGIQQSTLPIWN